MGEGASPLIADGFGGVSTQISSGGGCQGLQVAEAIGDVCVLQAKTCMPKFRTKGL